MGPVEQILEMMDEECNCIIALLLFYHIAVPNHVNHINIHKTCSSFLEIVNNQSNPLNISYTPTKTHHRSYQAAATSLAMPECSGLPCPWDAVKDIIGFHIASNCHFLLLQIYVVGIHSCNWNKGISLNTLVKSNNNKKNGYHIREMFFLSTLVMLTCAANAN